MRKLWLDTEFDGHNGPLISLAIASSDDYHWYGIMPLRDQVSPWVAVHVVPKLQELPSGVRFKYVERTQGPAKFRSSLLDYLRWQQGATIVADYPGDFRHLLQLFEGPSFEESWMPRFNLQLVNTPAGEPKPAIPHNALSDALALMAWDIRSGV